MRILVLIAICACFQQYLPAQGSRDSIVYYIKNESEINSVQYDARILDFSEALFSELNIDEIGAFFNDIEDDIESIQNILAKTYLREINCAYLSNSSRYDEAEACCLAIVEFGNLHNRSDILAYGLHDLSYIYNHQGKYKEQLAALTQVIDIWKELDISSEYLRYAVQQKAEGYSYLGMFDSSLYYMSQAEMLEKEYGDSLSLCNVYEKYSRIYLEQGEYLKSYEYGRNGLNLARALNSRVRTQTNLMYVGFSAFYLGRYKQAIEHELEALSLYEGARNSSTASIFIRLGRIYNSIEDYEQAIRYLKEAEDILIEVDYDVGLAKARTELAYTQIKSNNLEEAFNNLEFSTRIFTEIDDEVNLSLAQRRMALFYDAQNLCDLGLNIQNQAISKLENVDKKGSLATAYFEKANILNNCNRSIEAQSTALKGLELQKQAGDVRAVSESHLFLYNFYKEQGNKNSALYHYEEYVNYLKKITQSAEQQVIAEERARFKVEQIEKSNEIVTARNQVLNSRNRLYGVVAGSLLMIGSIGLFYLIKMRRLNSKIVFQNSKIEGQNLELRKLNNTKDRFFGIIAHDLRNPLIAFQGVGKQIRHYTKNQQLEKLTVLSKQIEALSNSVNTLLDNLLNWSLLQTGGIPYVPRNLNLFEEIDEVFEIVEPLALAKQIDVTVEIDRNLTVHADNRAIQTIFRNIVTNSLKYTTEEGNIHIRGYEEGGYIIVMIRDNGIGMSQKQLVELRLINKQSREGTHGEKGTGLGIILAYDLIALNKGEINIDSQEGNGTEVSISLPKGT